MVPIGQDSGALISARNLARIAAGIGPDGPQDYAQGVAYNAKLAEMILQYPQNFSSVTIAAAERARDRGYEPLEDTSWDFSLAADSLADSASKWGFQVSSGIVVGLVLIVVAPYLRRLLK